MTKVVPESDIEQIVGAERHPSWHYARAVSAEQTVYILHSHECKEAHPDLRTCPYSHALDNGIDFRAWSSVQDRVVRVMMRSDPERTAGAGRVVRIAPVAEAAAAAAEKPEHEIVWEFDDDYVTARAACNAVHGADCRLEASDPECQCEEWTVERLEDGTPYHTVTDWEGGGVRHMMRDNGGDCNVALFLEESDCIMELATRPTQFEIGRTAIKPVWNGYGYEWEPLS